MARGLANVRPPACASLARKSSLLPVVLALLAIPLLIFPLARASADPPADKSSTSDRTTSAHENVAGAPAHRYGPPGRAPGVPSPEELEGAGAVIGTVLVDNQNIFNLDDPKDDTKLFRLADRLHIKTRVDV